MESGVEGIDKVTLQQLRRLLIMHSATNNDLCESELCIRHSSRPQCSPAHTSGWCWCIYMTASALSRVRTAAVLGNGRTLLYGNLKNPLFFLFLLSSWTSSFMKCLWHFQEHRNVIITWHIISSFFCHVYFSFPSSCMIWFYISLSYWIVLHYINISKQQWDLLGKKFDQNNFKLIVLNISFFVTKEWTRMIISFIII